MRAIQYTQYGERDVLGVAEVPVPEPGRGELRVRVEAVSMNPVDAKVRRGQLRLIAGGHFPKRPGLDFAGVVEALGEGVVGFAVGDAVFGGARSMSEGALGERAVVSAGAIAHRPAGLSAVDAAAVPVVGVAALQVLRDVVRTRPGDRVLVNGASGGVGIFAVQLARRLGAHVTAVATGTGLALARELGADETWDYRERPVTAGTARHHAILELSGRLAFEEARALLDEHGLYVDFSPSPAALVGNALVNPFRGQKHLFAMTAARTADLDELAGAIARGELRLPPVTAFAFGDFQAAFALAESGGVVGKVVVRVA